MTIPIAAEYDPVDLVAGAGITPGVDILNAPLAKVVANHNFLGASFRPSLGSWFNDPGIASGVASQRFVLMIPVRQNTDNPGITVKLRCTNAAGSGARVYAYLVGSSTVAAFASIGASATSDLEIAITDTSPVGGQSGILFVSTLTNDVSVLAAEAHWTSATGTIADTPKASGYRYAQPAEVATTEPLTVEFMNRILEAPRTMFRTHAGSVFYMGDNLTTALGSGIWTTDRTVLTLVNRSWIDLRIKDIDIHWSGFAVGPSSSIVRVELTEPGSLNPSHTLDLSVAVTSLPGWGDSWTTFSGTMSGVESGLWRADVYLKAGSGSDLQLYALNGYQYK